MEGFKGTPGPWSVAFHGPNNCWIVDSERESAVAKIMRYKNNGQTQKYNFDLIAAAPELLEALQSIVTTDTEVLKILTPEQREAANAAIAKALGQ